MEYFTESRELSLLESLFRIIKYPTSFIFLTARQSDDIINIKGHFCMSQNGKGSKRRISLVSQDTWNKNYERIFRKKKDGQHNKSKNK